MSGERSEGEGVFLRRLRKSPEILVEEGIAKLALGILESLEKALDKSDKSDESNKLEKSDESHELDVGTIKHSLGTAVLAVVLITQLKDFAGELRRFASSSSQT